MCHPTARSQTGMETQIGHGCDISRRLPFPKGMLRVYSLLKTTSYLYHSEGKDILNVATEYL